MNATDGVIYGEVASGAVTINGKLLDLEKSLKVRNHSPTGFAWGYPGSGPAQLALAILLEFMAPDNALKAYQEFKVDVLLYLDSGSDFTLPVPVVMKWITDKQIIQ